MSIIIDGPIDITGSMSFELEYKPTGQVEFTTPGTYSWTAPAGVTSVCAVCVGAGGGGREYSPFYIFCWGGAGGGLGWKNNISVTPGQSYTVVVGAGNSAADGGDSYFINTSTVRGGGGNAVSGSPAGTALGGTWTGDGGGEGGDAYGGSSYFSAGGGAGGYSGNGGNGGRRTGSNTATNGGNGAGGGGGGGGGNFNFTSISAGRGGGGVGIYGEGASGAGGLAGTYPGTGQGGSGGGNGGGGAGGLYGGGASGIEFDTSGTPGAGGAVRIIWGPGRAFPSTLTNDL